MRRSYFGSGKRSAAAVGSFFATLRNLRMSASTDSEYLSKLRVHNDFNIKFGRQKQIVWVLGTTFAQAHDEHSDTIYSTGAVLYLNPLILEAKVFRNISSPGSVGSTSGLFSAGYGREGSQWIYLTTYWGGSGYMALQPGIRETVQNDFLHLMLTYLKWIAGGSGIKASLWYVELGDEYDLYGSSLGFFREF